MPLKLKLVRRGRIWYIRGTLRGRHVYETTETADRERAEQCLALREAQLWDRALKGERGTHSFAEACVLYLTNRNPGPWFRAALKRLVDHFERFDVTAIDQRAIDAYVAQHHPRSRPATLINAVITPLTAVLRSAARRGWCDVPSFERPKLPPQRFTYLTPEEAERLVGAAAPHLRPLILFLLHTGARLGEALELQWREVDLRARRVVFLETKNGTSRGVPLNDSAWRALASLPHRDGHVFRRPPRHVGRRRRGKVEPMVEPAEGMPYHDRRGLGGSPIKKAWAGACRRAGFYREVPKLGSDGKPVKDAKGRPVTAKKPTVRPHDLRHTFASWLAMRSVPLRTIAELLGHKTLAMVMRYAHLSPDHLRDAVGALDQPAAGWAESVHPAATSAKI